MSSASPIAPHATSPVGARYRRASSRHDSLKVTLRQATRDDCQRIARLYMIASDGVAEYIWSRIHAPELSLLEIGTQRYARENTDFSYRNCTVAEKDGAVVGMMLGFEMREPPPEGRGAEPAREVDPVLEPYTHLEDYGSLYISALAVFNEHRGLGIGTRLLQEARRRARAMGFDRLSLICFEQNFGAMRLYRRLGFVEIKRRPIVPHPFLHYREGDAILLACSRDGLNLS